MIDLKKCTKDTVLFGVLGTLSLCGASCSHQGSLRQEYDTALYVSIQKRAGGSPTKDDITSCQEQAISKLESDLPSDPLDWTQEEMETHLYAVHSARDIQNGKLSVQSLMRILEEHRQKQ